MNLEDFLICIHNGAYEVENQLLMHELDVKDRIQLRLVSRATNLVVLEWPVLNTLYISTHSPDLDYLEVVSSNEKLLKHVSQLVWDHSTFYLCFLLPGDEHEKFENKEDVLQSLGKSNEMGLMRTWKAQATSQRENLESDRDVALLTRIFPFLNNVHSITFAVCFRTPRVTGISPARITYSKMPANWSPIALEWPDIDGTYLPQSGIKDPADEDVITSHNFEDPFWDFLPVRGIRMFYDLLSQVQSTEDYNDRMNLHNLFPKLKNISFHDIPAKFVSYWGGGQVYRVLQDSTSGLRELTLSLTHPGREVNYADIQSMIQASSSSLQSLTVKLRNAGWGYAKGESLMRVLIGVLPQLAVLSSLELSLWVKVTPELMEAFGESIGTCRSMRKLTFQRMCSYDGFWWSEVLDQWRQSRCLHHLDWIEFDKCKDIDRHLGPSLESRSRSAVVDWLHEKTDQFPLVYM